MRHVSMFSAALKSHLCSIGTSWDCTPPPSKHVHASPFNQDRKIFVCTDQTWHCISRRVAVQAGGSGTSHFPVFRLQVRHSFTLFRNEKAGKHNIWGPALVKDNFDSNMTLQLWFLSLLRSVPLTRLQNAVVEIQQFHHNILSSDCISVSARCTCPLLSNGLMAGSRRFSCSSNPSKTLCALLCAVLGNNAFMLHLCRSCTLAIRSFLSQR